MAHVSLGGTPGCSGTPQPMQRTIVVGDVHGCLVELEALARAVGWTPDDRLVLAGDLVAKGPDSQGVVQFAREHGAIAVMGNHDQHVLRARAAEQAGGPMVKLKAEHAVVLKALAAADWAYLETLPFYTRLGPERAGGPDTVVLHGGALPAVPLAAQSRDDLVNMRSVLPDGRSSRRIDGVSWASQWRGPERIIFGHDAIRGLQQHPWALGLDTGCVYGNRLTAVILPERRLVAVPAQRDYVGVSR